MTQQYEVLLTQDDIDAIRSALSFLADNYENFARGNGGTVDVRRAHWAEAEQARSLSVFLANVSPTATKAEAS